MTKQQTDKLVLAYVQNSTGVLELNRPRALNSINHEMVELICDALDAWRDDESVHRVVLLSRSEKAFCAGGDVRASREEALKHNHAPADQFFTEEYDMNEQLAAFPKPIVSVINGVVMGGGLGVSMHGSHRVVTENVLAAMPEMAIGFCPDVGATWKFSRMKSSASQPSLALAQFLCLTGYRMDAADMIYTGLATDFVESSDVDDFVSMVIAESLDEALERYAGQPSEESKLSQLRSSIEECFGFDSYAEIEQALARSEDKEFVALVSQLTAAASPTSLVASARLVATNARVDSLRKALDNEFRLGAQLRREHDFVEGVRAVLVDKDRTPAFSPAKVSEVEEDKYRALLRN